MTITTKIVLSSIVLYPLLGALLFWPAGTLRWWWGASFFLFFVGGCIALNRWLLVHDPALLEERMRVGANQKAWDKVFLALIYVFFLTWWVGMPLDAVRYHWSGMPSWLHAIGIVATAGSFAVLFATFRANPFLSGVVRIQDDRGQTVISTGPYRLVRHPMYAGAALLFLGTALWLGSWLGVALGAGFGLLLATRAVLEERTLSRELAGYAEYAKRVRRRLIPFVW